MPDLPLEAAPIPRFDPVAGKYVWEPAASGVAPLEPAFVREAIRDISPYDDDAVVRAPQGVTTFADVYPRGTRDHAETDAPSIEDEPDPLAEWRVPGAVADDILIALPEGTPKMIRTLLTLILGGMRRG